MLFRLPFFFEARLKLALLCRDDENCNISLACSHNHAGDVVFMARRIEKCKSPMFEIKHELGALDSFSLGSLVGVDVGDICQLPCLHMLLFRLLLIPSKLLLVNKL